MSHRIAALDAGSNTVHLLVGEVVDGRVREVRRVVSMPRLGAAVEATGRIGEAKLREVAAEVARQAAVAREEGARVLLFGATEAVRRAPDRDEALRVLGDAAGVPCVLLSGEAEARLAFRGAVSVVRDSGTVLVCDVGGGSTECVLGDAQRIDALASLPLGSGAATDQWLQADPPTDAELDACRAWVDEVLHDAPHGEPEHAVITGGTASTLPALLGRERESELTAHDLQQCRALLRAGTSEEIARSHDITLARARVLAGGVEIIDALRALYGLDRVRITIHGLRSGMILAWTETGERWTEG